MRNTIFFHNTYSQTGSYCSYCLVQNSVNLIQVVFTFTTFSSNYPFLFGRSLRPGAEKGRYYHRALSAAPRRRWVLIMLFELRAVVPLSNKFRDPGRFHVPFTPKSDFMCPIPISRSPPNGVLSSLRQILLICNKMYYISAWFSAWGFCFKRR